MNDKLNLDEIRKIPKEEFKQILQNWMKENKLHQEFSKRLRKQIFSDFQQTELGKRIEIANEKYIFNCKDFVLDALQAEHLYNQKNFYSLSVFITECKNQQVLPNFESEDHYRFQKNDIQEMFNMMGLVKGDKLARRVLNVYKSANESLLSILLKELINSHNSVECSNIGTQTEIPKAQPYPDLSVISSKSKPKRKNQGLVSQEFRVKKTKKPKDVNLIAQNLEQMSNNISVITNKLDTMKKSPNEEDTKMIINHVATIMSQLDGCVGNFERLCDDIKKTNMMMNETRSQNYDEWIDDLKNSENGRKFLKKLQKSFTKVVDEEKMKAKKHYQLKLSKEKSKLSRLYRSATKSIVVKHKRNEEPPDFITKEINDLFENTCQMFKNMEKESKLFEKSIEMDIIHKKTEKTTKPLSIERKAPDKEEPNLNECCQIHSAASSSIKSNPSYSASSFEADVSEIQNNE